ncbi:unnamed protein product [Adineta ricciae]|uniref:Uncharacterized protein n=1 Tax=Adineta ricciae TaxID=249248 RepID=A0A816GYJ8_ADIRI|nr:unnamed protein product [Adineta ricciae]
MNEQLNETVDVSYRTMKHVEAKIIPVQKKIEKQKRRIRDMTTRKGKIDVAIKNVKNQMNIMENLIQDKQKDLDRAEDDVKEAERKLERAKLCRSKRFWGWNPISEIKKISDNIATGVSNAAETIVDGTKHVVSKTEEAVKDVGDNVAVGFQNAGETLKDVGNEAAHDMQNIGQAVADQVSEHYETVEDGVKEYVIKPVCSVFNHEGINNARYIRNEALNSLQNARDQLQKHRSQLSNYQNNKQRLELDLTRANDLINELNIEIGKLYTNLNLTSTINYELKIAVHHVSILSSRSHVLKEEIKYLIDFNLLIQPLNNIYNELKNNNLLSQAIDDQHVLITEEEIESIQNSLNELMNILPNVPMNTSENELLNDDDANCDEGRG